MIFRKKLFLIVIFISCSSVNSFQLTMMLPKQNKIPHISNLHHYYRLSRPESIPYEFGLPLMGSYLSTNSINVITNPSIILLGILSVLIGSNSMIINDYFDYRNGCDRKKDDKILNQKIIKPEEILHISNILNLLSYSLICYFVNDDLIRIILSNAIIFSYIYTPILKPITLIKNLSVSLIITQSLTMGGLITNTKPYSLLPAAIYLFNFVMWQELQLDNLDMCHDKRCGIKTFPVLFGYRKTNILSLLFLMAGTFIPFGTKSHLFILLQTPIIIKTFSAICLNEKLPKKEIKMSRLIILLSGIHMSLLS